MLEDTEPPLLARARLFHEPQIKAALTHSQGKPSGFFRFSLVISGQSFERDCPATTGPRLATGQRATPCRAAVPVLAQVGRALSGRRANVESRCACRGARA